MKKFNIKKKSWQEKIILIVRTIFAIIVLFIKMFFSWKIKYGKNIDMDHIIWSLNSFARYFVAQFHVFVFVYYFWCTNVFILSKIHFDQNQNICFTIIWPNWAKMIQRFKPKCSLFGIGIFKSIIILSSTSSSILIATILYNM